MASGAYSPRSRKPPSHIIGERRLRTLRDLAARAGSARNTEEACIGAAETLAANAWDVPFAALYLLDDNRVSARLVGTAGIEPGAPAAPASIPVSGMAPPLAAAVRNAQTTEIANLSEMFGPLPGGAWDTPCQCGIVLPIMMPGQTDSSGFVLAGVSRRKRLDVSYRTFFELVRGHISNAIANARAYQEERRQAEALAEIDRAKTVFSATPVMNFARRSR